MELFNFETDTPEPGDRFEAQWGDSNDPDAVYETAIYTTGDDGLLRYGNEVLAWDDIVGLAYTDQLTYLGRTTDS